MSTLGRGNVFARGAEGVALAFEAIRSNVIRASLTILGIAIGVMVVIAIASMITGIKTSISDVVSRAGPNSFMVLRDFSPGFHIDDGSDENNPRRRRPWLTDDDARLIAKLPGIEDVNVSSGGSSRVSYRDKQLGSIDVSGFEASWMRVEGGELLDGRNFSPMENANLAFVAIINDAAAKNLFENLDPIGKTVRLYGFPFTIIGRYLDPSALFDTPQPKFIIPRSTFQQVTGTRRDYVWGITVMPRAGVTQEEAMDQVTVALRVKRGLKPAEENSFDLVSGAQFMESFNKITQGFFLVMLVLSSIGLMVGGVGVIAIMLISVTERTREIGVRKALGATRGEILFQFLVEAATLTLVGGLCGMALGAMIAWGINSFTPIPATIPLWSVVAATVASIITGVCFGLYPANKAARLDPVEALRYE